MRSQEIMQRLYGRDIWLNYTPGEKQQVIQGWNGDHPALTKYASQSHIIIDVGVWKGLSTITMALAMKEAGIDGAVVAVDTWLGACELWDVMLDEHRRGQPSVYSQFMNNVYWAGVKDYVVPLAFTSSAASKLLRRRVEIEADLIHIDASHEYQDVVNDIDDYWQLLKPGGVMVGDDYGDFITVKNAANRFSTMMGLPLTIDLPKWIVAKPNV